MARENLLTLFGDFARYARDRAVVSSRGFRQESSTYLQLVDQAAGAALALRRLGVCSGDRVLLWGVNSAEWMAAFWGCLLRGAVAVPIDEASHPEFASRVVREAEVKFAFLSGVKPLPSGVRYLRLEDLPDSAAEAHVVAAPHSGKAPRPLYETLADEPIGRSHVAEILFTSGSTAEPRGVVLTHGNFLANLEPLEQGIAPYRKYERWMHPLRFVSLVPLSHVFGQFMALFVPPLIGATVAFEHSTNPSDILRTIRRERATALVAVPRLLDALCATLQREFESESHQVWFRRAWAEAEGKPFLRRAWKFRRIHRRLGWRFWAFISGGAALASGTENFFKRLGFAVVQGYGMTESASLISLNHPFRATEGSLGKLLPGREFRMAEDGEILVRGENVSAGYWERGGVQPLGEGGWLGTGDLGDVDAQGHLCFRGRKKNLIVTPAGLKIYPEDLEQALRGQPEVRDALVIATSFRESGEGASRAHGETGQPLAVLSLRHGVGQDGAADAVNRANHSLAEYQQIREWQVWPEEDFPRTPTGKPRLAVIRGRVAQLRGVADGGTTAEDGTGDRAAIAGAAPDSRVDALLRQLASRKGAILEEELRLSSLDRVELLSALEQKHQVELSESAFAQARTLGELRKLLASQLAPASQGTGPSPLPDQRQARLLQAGTRTYAYPRWALSGPVRWLRLAVYYALVWPATQLLGHPRVIGRENLRGVSGPVLLVSNHITRRADIGLILAALPHRFRHRLAVAMGGETLLEMRHPPREWIFAKRRAYWLGYWMVTALFNVFPLPQFSGVRESFRFAGESMDRGYSVLVFPEGVVNNTATGEMAPFQAGIGMLARELHARIVPMRLEGVWQMKQERRRLAKRGELNVRIGVPVSFRADAPPEEIAEKLEIIVLEL